MKRKLYWLIIIVLLFLTACTQPTIEYQSKNTNLINMLDFQHGIPANIPSSKQDGGISLENYPIYSKDFFIDTRTNEEKMDIIRTWAPDNIEKEIALYNAELERIGVNLKDIEYRASIVDDPSADAFSWVLYPYHKKLNKPYIVSIDGVINPAIDLFNFFDKSVEDDFFDLVLVNIPYGEAIGDKSGWHVFGRVSNGKVTSWYDANNDRIKTVQVELAPTVETSEIKINSTFPMKDIIKGVEHPENYSPLTLDDITSGKYLEALIAEEKKNPSFTSEAIPRDNVLFMPIETYLRTSQSYIDTDILIIKPIPEDKNNSEVRPIKIVSYSPFADTQILKDLGWLEKYLNYNNYPWIVTWAYINPDKTVTFGNTMVHLTYLLQNNQGCIYGRTDVDGNKIDEGGHDPALGTVVRIGNVAKDTDSEDLIYDNNLIVKMLYELYPNLSPEPYLQQWKETGQMSEKLQKTVFGWSANIHYCWQ